MDDEDSEAENEKTDTRANNDTELAEEEEEEEEKKNEEDEEEEKKNEMTEQDVTENTIDDSTMQDTDDVDAGQKTKHQRTDETNIEEEEENQDEQEELSSSKQQGTSSSGNGEYHEGIAPQNEIRQENDSRQDQEKQPNPLRDLNAAIHHWKSEIRSLEGGDDEEEEEEEEAGNQDNEIENAQDVMHSKSKNTDSVLAAHEEDVDAMDEDAMNDDDGVDDDSDTKEKNKSNEMKDNKQQLKDEENDQEEMESKLSKSSKNRWDSLESTWCSSAERENIITLTHTYHLHSLELALISEHSLRTLTRNKNTRVRILNSRFALEHRYVQGGGRRGGRGERGGHSRRRHNGCTG